MTDPVPKEVAQEIAGQIFAGRKIQAIKIYRDHTGQGLAESKAFIEALEAELRAGEPEKFTSPEGKGCVDKAALLVAIGVIVLVAIGVVLAIIARHAAF